MVNEEQQRAIDFVKSNKQLFINHVIEQFSGHQPEKPIAVFMAGTPGVGKTEVATNLLSMFTEKPVRIDADEFRELIPGYTGANSEVVQVAASIAVDKVMDAVIARSIPFILDGTFAVGKAVANIKRAYRHGYVTQIYYIYQDPLAAWRFTKIREKKEGRRVPKEAFIHAYYTSRINVQAVMDELGDYVTLHVLTKDYTNGKHKTYVNVDGIENILPKLYTEDELMELLND